MPAQQSPLVHLELHTGDMSRACDFYSRLCGWRSERVSLGSGSYRSLQLGGAIAGGVVECPTSRSLWLPYVEVGEIFAMTERARQLGARVLLEPREGPAGWRSVVSQTCGAELALWQQKR